uniref:chorismate mutase n=1 Tax=Chlamydomonas leiostraca TaxID=1034604 RepID=A0A7S0RHI4_9CHLO|mmetsp:Transcript_22784/g.57944  ORF Transcript_22784/g.57944 Transcript_22784/m.57944 type:complete len:361 (+) Transcript_22784:52-1134(+)
MHSLHQQGIQRSLRPHNNKHNIPSRLPLCSGVQHQVPQHAISSSGSGFNSSCYTSSRQVDCKAVLQGTTQDMSAALTLENIRSSLIRQEDTIIFAFIERAQFARNEAVYTPDAIPVPGYNRDGSRYSLLQYVVRETEQLHAKLRRYTSPDEHPFFPDELPPMVLPPILYPPVLAPCSEEININDEVMSCYIEHVIPGITQAVDDYNYGSAAVLDVLCLQALSKRIHYGKFVAEAKFRAKPEQYSALIHARDAAGIMDLLTDKAVEKKVVERVRLKCMTFGQDVLAPGTPSTPSGGGNGGSPKLKVSPEVVARVYEEWVMPLTKEVEVQYLLKRLDHVEGAPAQKAERQSSSASASSKQGV